MQRGAHTRTSRAVEELLKPPRRADIEPHKLVSTGKSSTRVAMPSMIEVCGLKDKATVLSGKSTDQRMSPRSGMASPVVETRCHSLHKAKHADRRVVVLEVMKTC